MINMNIIMRMDATQTCYIIAQEMYKCGWIYQTYDVSCHLFNICKLQWTSCWQTNREKFDAQFLCYTLVFMIWMVVMVFGLCANKRNDGWYMWIDPKHQTNEKKAWNDIWDTKLDSMCQYWPYQNKIYTLESPKMAVDI